MSDERHSLRLPSTGQPEAPLVTHRSSLIAHLPCLLPLPHPHMLRLALARPVFRHRLLMNFHARAERVTADDVVAELVKAVPMPKSGM